MAKGFELTALFLLLPLRPQPKTARAGSPGRGEPRLGWGWGLLTGAGFVLLFLFASGSLT